MYDGKVGSFSSSTYLQLPSLARPTAHRTLAALAFLAALIGGCSKDKPAMTRGEVCTTLTEPMATASARCMAQLGMGTVDDLYAANRKTFSEECCRGSQCQGPAGATRSQLSECLAALKKLDCSDPSARTRSSLLPETCVAIVASRNDVAGAAGGQRPGKRLSAMVSGGNIMGVVNVTVKNGDSFDWTNVKVCINDRWCSDGHVGSESNQTIKVGDQWTLNWFMQNSIAYRDALRAGQIPGRGTISDFIDENGSQNKVNEPINSVSVRADQGTWSQSY